jgi:NTE family protein
VTTAVVLSGGGSLGAVQAGMLQALDEAGVVPDLIVGTSAGALNAAYVAGRRWPGAAAGLGEIWAGRRRTDVFPLSVAAGVRAAAGRADHVIRPAGLAALVESTLDYTQIEDAVIRLAVVATEIVTGREVVLTRGPVVSAVLASAALPGVFPPVTIESHQLFDGGLVNHTPLSVAARLGADRVYVLPTGYACALPSPPRTAFGMVMHAFSLATHQRLASDVAALQGSLELLVAPPLCPLRIAPSDFSQAATLAERARTSTAAWLSKPMAADQTRHLRLHSHDHRAGQPAQNIRTGLRE